MKLTVFESVDKVMKRYSILEYPKYGIYTKKRHNYYAAFLNI